MNAIITVMVGIVFLTGCHPEQHPGDQIVSPSRRLTDRAEQTEPIVSLGEPRPDVLPTFELEVPFEILNGGVLIMGLEEPWHTIEPRQPFEELYLQVGGESFLIDDMSKLRRRVAIRSPDEALAFCRLKTSPRTYYLWGDSYETQEVEVLTKEQVTAGLCWGDKAFCEFLRSLESDHLGVITAEERLGWYGIGATKVSAIDQGFEIKRTLIVEDFTTEPGEVHLAEVVEVIGPEAHYTREETQVIDTTAPLPSSWHFPWFE